MLCFMKNGFSITAIVLVGLVAGVIAGQDQGQTNPQVPPPGAQNGTEFGFGIFQQRCMSCHGNPDAAVKAPEPAALRQLTPEAIMDALTNGVMKLQGQSLSDLQKKQVA